MAKAFAQTSTKGATLMPLGTRAAAATTARPAAPAGCSR